MAVCAVIPGWCRDLLKVCRCTPWSPTDHTETTADIRFIIKTEEMIFFQDPTDNLGLAIQVGLLGILTKAIDGIRVLQHPPVVNELKSFLVLRNEFRLVVLNLAYVATPLNRKLGNDQPFQFGWPNKTEVEVLKTLWHELLTSVTTDTITTNAKRMLYAWPRWLWSRSRCVLSLGPPERPPNDPGY